MAWAGEFYKLNQLTRSCLPTVACAELQMAAVCILFLTQHLPSCFLVDILVLVRSAWRPLQTWLGISGFGVDMNKD